MEKLKLKEELYWKLFNGEITVFSTNSDLKKKIEVEDTETVFNFLLFLTEFRTMEEIYSYPILSRQDKDVLLAFLKEKKYLTTHWNYSQKKHRLNKFVSSFPNTNYEDYLNILDKINVLILGLGTAGSYQIELLRKIGITNFTIVDGDIVENKNLGAQNFYSSDIGKLKTKATYERYQNEGLSIHTIDEYITNYNSLKTKVDLSQFDFIINCADDHKLCLDIISNIFIEYPHTKIFLNGYSVLQQYSYQVDFNNYVPILKKLKKELEIKDNARHIAINSGSIFNAFFLTISIGKMIFDDIFSVGNSTYASADFYQNNFYIGSTFDKFLHNEFEKTKKEQIKNINPMPKKEAKWICPINLENIKENKLVYKPTLSSEQQEFMLVETDNNFYNYCLKRKKTFKNYQNIDFNDIKFIFINYVKETFPKEILKKVENALDNSQVYSDHKRFSKEKSFAKKISDDVTVVYSVDNRGVSEQANSLIHEMFHLIYFSISDKTYDHEQFVRKNHTLFLSKYKDDDKIKELAKSYLHDSYNSYIGLHLTLEYEKYTLTNQTALFFEKHVEAKDNAKEFLVMLNNYISPYEPLATCKYYLPLENDQGNLKRLEERLNAATMEK